MALKIKVLISKNKRRFQENGFDLDLSYITPNIIAMGFPAEKLEGVYRNHIDDVVKFLEHGHKGRYKVYNLCSERNYDKAKFHGPISDYPFDDHHPPPFQMIEEFCKDVINWFSADQSNIAVVHCKAGKGRTGVMICSCLLHLKLCTDANDALRFYSFKRTKDDKGVTIPSQRRYVCYYDKFLRNGLAYTPRQLLLQAIRFETLPFNCSGNCALFFKVLSPERQLFQSEVYEKPKKADRPLVMLPRRPLVISGDICIEFFNKPKMMKKEKVLHFWFNTSFISDEEAWSCDSSCSGHANNSEPVSVCPVHHFFTAAGEAHRQREQLQSQVMEQLCQLSQLQQQQQQMAPSHGDIRQSCRYSDKYQEQRASSGLLLGGTGFKATEHNSFRSFLTLTLKKSELDKANKDKQHKLFTEDFAVKLFLTTTDFRASTFASQSLPSKSKHASPLDSISSQSDSIEDSREATVSDDDDHSYDNSLSETDDEDNNSVDDEDDDEVVDCRCIHDVLENTRL